MCCGASALEVPQYSSPVLDRAGLISSELEADLARRLEEIWKSGGSQIAVLTIPSLEGESIEGYSIRVTDQWKLGDAKRDNGILLLISIQDRQMRIEVGQGLEGDLPDVQAKRIISDVITPFFRNQEFEVGIVEGIRSILSFSDPKVSLGGSRAAPSRRSGKPQSVSIFQLLFFLFLFFLFSIFGRRRRRSSWGTAALGALGGYSAGRSSRGFGGFGGGGFSGGGGGGFSGGGASGSW